MFGGNNDANKGKTKMFLPFIVGGPILLVMELLSPKPLIERSLLVFLNIPAALMVWFMLTG